VTTAPQKQNASAALTTVQDWQKFLVARADGLAQWSKGTGLDPRTLVRIALRELQSDSKLRQCSPESFYLALTAAAQLGLEPTGVTGEAYLVPFNVKVGDNRWEKRVQLIPGYQGLAKLVYQTGKVQELWADVVHANDHFRVVRGSDPRLEHEPVIVGERGELVAAYACARLAPHGGVRFEVLTREDVDKIKSASKQGHTGPWVEWYDEMAKKSAVRRLCKLLPKTHLLAKAVAYDNAVEAGDVQRIPQILDVEALDEQPAPAAAAPTSSAKSAIRQAANQRASRRPPATENKSSEAPPPASSPSNVNVETTAPAAAPRGDAKADSVEDAEIELLERVTKLEDAIADAASPLELDEAIERAADLPDGYRAELDELAKKRRQELSK
jgi:recombination protein RecT